MNKDRPGRSTKARGARKPVTALDRLEPEEAKNVLCRLLAAHPDLRPEAEQMARSFLSEVDFKTVAKDLAHGLCALNMEDLGSRAGRHRGSYTAPTQAAWDLLQGAVDPFLANMKRQLELGLKAEALETGKGILLALYNVRDMKGHELLEWVPDFPTEAAVYAVRVLAGRETKRAGKTTPGWLRFDEKFFDKHIPEWSDLIARTLEGE